MILVDANLLIYAFVKDMPLHREAFSWLEDRLNDSPRVGLPWPSLLAFVRLVTNPRIFEKPADLDSAFKQVGAWLEAGPVWVPQPSEKHAELLERCLSACSSSNQVPDAHLAALALEHGLELHSADQGFARFPGLRWRNPLDRPFS